MQRMGRVRSPKEPPYHYFGSRILRIKIPYIEGNDVKVLQSLLHLCPPIMVWPPPPLDGVFGQSTRQAVKQFQRYFGLAADGVVDQETYYYLGHRTGSYAHNEPVFSSRLLGYGSRGPDTAVLQNRLAAFRRTQLNRPANGRFDFSTEQALRCFQSCFPDLKTDGIAGPEVFDKLLCWCPLGGRTLKKGRHGLDTYFLQYILFQLGYYSKTPNGFFDQRTEKALLQFQQDAGIAADGVAGNKTYLALGTVVPFPNHRYYYRAASKDNVAQIARLFNKSSEDIIKSNQLAAPDFSIEPGQLLVIPPPLTFHLTAKGDTLENIAHRYAIPLEDLKRANPWLPPGTLMPDDMVVLPRHRQDYQGSIIYLEYKNRQAKLEQLHLKDFRILNLFTTEVSSPPRLFVSADQLKAAVLDTSRSQLILHDRSSNISRFFRLANKTEHMSWSPDNRKLIINGNLVISASNAQPRFKLEGNQGQWLADSFTLVYRQGRHQLRKVHSESGRDQELLSLPGEDIISFFLHPGTHQLVIFSQVPADRNTLTYSYNLLTGELKEFSRNDHMAVWSEDGNLLVLLAREYYGDFFPWFYQKLHLYSPASLDQELDVLPGKSIKICPGCFSPDNQYYVLTLSIPTAFYAVPEQPGDLFIKRIGARTITQITINQNVSYPVWIKG